ncbi:OPT superfamily oligopeptide transporter [Ascobolus immersus RN42]|uniref:OPT superfamily oligopeptide transporter n=1 Tax=Ascobolus immersus RN42 TaxID=1160509 RepID=A0A3N4I459_ASCIM|nr:OPT superfamily oligopeptide transporter [Ascobolus immersus RN42]
MNHKSNQRQFTLRAVLVGLFVGSIVCFSNVSMMSMPSSLIGFAIFKAISSHLTYTFTPVENVLVQTVAVAVGSMPLTASLVGVIPAVEHLLKKHEGGPIELSLIHIIIWSLGVAFFGVFFAVPLRKQVIVKEKLKFPSGTATALLISVLHGDREGVNIAAEAPVHDTVDAAGRPLPPRDEPLPSEEKHFWRQSMRSLLYAFLFSGAFTLLSYFVPMIRDLPVFGAPAAQYWLWTVNPSPAYVGQGIIMGFETTMHMLVGAIIGWGILSPLAKERGWAPGDVSDWKNGARGWIVWVSLAIMLADSVFSLGSLVFDNIWDAYVAHRKKKEVEAHRDPIHDFSEPLLPTRPSLGVGRSSRDPRDPSGRTASMAVLYSPKIGARDDGEAHSSSIHHDHHLRHRHPHKSEGDDYDGAEVSEEIDAPPEHLISGRVVYIGLFLSALLCIGAIAIVFPQTPLSASTAAFFLALVMSVMGVRALGQTDLNPVSGISKLTQLIFAMIIPSSNKHAVLINLVAGATSEAGAMQAGDLMQDLKTGYILGASPKAQFYGQLIGAAFGSVISAIIYKIYSNVYEIPSKLFQVPAAYVWIDCSRLMYGQGLPSHAYQYAMVFGAVFAVTTLVKTRLLKGSSYAAIIPGGVAVAIGMYNVPSFTLGRLIGGLFQGYSRRLAKGKDRELALIILASGLILGEGVVSMVNLFLAFWGVPHLE